MPRGKSISRAKSNPGLRNGLSNGDKGAAVAGRRSRPSVSDSDDDNDNVMRQLLTPARRGRRTRPSTTRPRVASRRDVGSDGPGSDSDNRGSAMSEDDDLPSRRRHRVGTESPATTPMGSPSQTPGPTTSSSDGSRRQPDAMDVDSERGLPARRPTGDRPARGPDTRSNEARVAEPSAQQTNTPVSYIPCHTWPPCAVCARISGQPPPTTQPSLFTLARQRQLALAREAARAIPPPPPPPPPAQPPSPPPVFRPTNPAVSLPPPLLRLPAARAEDRWNDDFVPPPLSPPPPPYDPPAANRPRPMHPSIPPHPQYPSAPTQPQLLPRPPHAPYMVPPSYPMEPLYVSAGYTNMNSNRHMYRPSAQQLPQHVIRPVTYSQMSANARTTPYSRVPRTAQASSSAAPAGDEPGPSQGEANGSGSGSAPPRPRGRGKGKSKKLRAKRYNRKKREEWPPIGWNPIWEEERPRRWEGYEIPDEIAPDRVYEHLRRRFDLKSMGHCKWEGCVPTEASKDGYKMLKRHVETVHLGLKLVCKLCGVRKRADNRRKATHKRGCPEREDGSIAMPPEGTIPLLGAAAAGSEEAEGSGSQQQPQQPSQQQEQDSQDSPMEEDEEMGSEGADDEEDEEIEEDELEEDELEEDQLDEDQGDPIPDQHMDSEFESEDD